MADLHRLRRLLRRRRVLRRRKVFRRVADPFYNMSDDDIFQRYRFRRATIMFILRLISPFLQFPSGKSMAVPALVQLLACLRFYATGSFYRLVGDSLGLSVATVSRCVDRVTFALCRLSREYIKFPEDAMEVSSAKRLFFEMAGFPQVLGCVDGTFIRIQAPKQNEEDYVNRKGFHSLNVQMVCDAKFKITNCVAKWPGSVHDSRMFRDSHLCRNFENGKYSGILLGDSAYPCRNFLMTPYAVCDTDSKRKFNRALCRTRVTIEQTFGILKRRFSCLHTGLRLSPQKSAAVVLACVVLHNLGIDRGDIINTDHDVVNAPDPNINLPHDIADGERIREYIRETYFQ